MVKNHTVLLSLFLLKISSSFSVESTLIEIDFSKVNSQDLPFVLQVDKVLADRGEIFCLANDLNNNGEDELIFCSNYRPFPTSYNFIQIEQYKERKVLARVNCEGRISVPSFFDLNNDNNKEIIYSETNEKNVILHVISYLGEHILELTIATRPSWVTRKWACFAEAAAIMDVNRDGWQDLVVIVKTDEAYQPRGVYTVDVHNKMILWLYPTGFVPWTLYLVDFNNDGKREIIFGSTAPNNNLGHLINGTDDSKSYLTALDSLGNKRFQLIVGKEFSNCRLHVHDIDGDKTSESIALFTSGIQPPEPSFIGIWNIEKETIAPKVTIEKSLKEGACFTDLDQDGQDDILIPWYNSSILEWRDSRLNIMKTVHLKDFVIESTRLADLDSNGEKEVFVSGTFHDQDIIAMLNPGFKLLAIYSRNRLPFADFDDILNLGYGKEKLLMVNFQDSFYTLRIQKQVRIIPLVSKSWIIAIFLAGTIFASLIVIIWYPAYNKNYYNKIIKMSFNPDPVAILILDHKGMALCWNEVFEKMSNLTNPTKARIHIDKLMDVSDFPEMKTLIQESYSTGRSIKKEVELSRDSIVKSYIISVEILNKRFHKKIWIVKIVDITEIVRSRRVLAWASMAQRLAHEIKTPLSTIMLSVQRLEMEFEKGPAHTQILAKYFNHITIQVDRLQRMTDGFLKFSNIEKLHFERFSIHDFIKNLWQTEYAGLGLKVRWKFKFHSDALYRYHNRPS